MMAILIFAFKILKENSPISSPRLYRWLASWKYTRFTGVASSEVGRDKTFSAMEYIPKAAEE